MALVDKGRLLAGAVPFKLQELANVTDTFRGQVLTAQGDTVSAVIKDLPERELANEVLGTAVGTYLGLPVPKAYIAACDDATLKTKHAPRIGKSSFVFASADVSTPSVAQIVLPGEPGVQDRLRILVNELQKAPKLGEFYAFDVWLANIDRHIGNLLFGAASSSIWLIDHGRCLSGPTWSAASLVADADFKNRLKDWLTPGMSSARRSECATEADSLIGRLGSVEVRRVCEDNMVASLLPAGDLDALVTFLGDRIPHVKTKTADALGLVA